MTGTEWFNYILFTFDTHTNRKPWVDQNELNKVVIKFHIPGTYL